MSKRSTTIKRRLVSVPAIFLAAIALTVLLPVWIVILGLYDLVRAPRRMPHLRLVAFAFCWAWIEVAGLTVSFFIWVTGQVNNQVPLNTLQRWWAARVVGALRITCGLKLTIDGEGLTSPGPVVVLARHASLADSVVSLFIVAPTAATIPRYVLKRELLSDPCLDVAGNRGDNHFLDRSAVDAAPELAALKALSAGMGADGVATIFPEGTRANPKKVARALEKIGERDPERANRLRALKHLLPPRPAGSYALVSGAPTADIVILSHVGFEGLDTFSGILKGVPGKYPIHLWLRRIARAEVPRQEAEFTLWLDNTWLAVDREIDDALLARQSTFSN